VEELIDAGDLVIASTVMHGQGSASGADVSDAYVFVYRLRDGLIVEGWEYRTRQEAEGGAARSGRGRRDGRAGRRADTARGGVAGNESSTLPAPAGSSDADGRGFAP
jgi:hypothetical protein